MFTVRMTDKKQTNKQNKNKTKQNKAKQKKQTKKKKKQLLVQTMNYQKREPMLSDVVDTELIVINH